MSNQSLLQTKSMPSKAPKVQRKQDGPALAGQILPARGRAAHLQRTLGNRALGQLIVQAKLTLGPVNDPYEQEADRVAKQVVQQVNQPQPAATPANSGVQRATTPEQEESLARKVQSGRLQRAGNPLEEEKAPLMAKRLPGVLQRVATMPEEEKLHTKPAVQRNALVEGGAVDADTESAIQRARGAGQPLATNVRAPLEQAFGADFSRVHVHTGEQSDALNQSLQARAFTTGQDIFFRQGEYNPGNTAGQELLAHELTHVVQQNGDVVKKKQCDACDENGA
ncbi:MAG: DUF4157 domain-containing protein [Caldilineaceae bacterium]